MKKVLKKAVNHRVFGVFFGVDFFDEILKILQKCYNMITIKLQTKEMRGKYDQYEHTQQDL